MHVATPQLPLTEAQTLSVEQPRATVDAIIAKGDKLFVEPADNATPLSELMGPATREFFSRYRSLRTRRGGFQLAVSALQSSEYVRGYVSIGHSEDWDVILRPGNDEVFVVEGSEIREAEMEVRFPSDYHLVLDEAQRT